MVLTAYSFFIHWPTNSFIQHMPRDQKLKKWSDFFRILQLTKLFSDSRLCSFTVPQLPQRRSSGFGIQSASKVAEAPWLKWNFSPLSFFLICLKSLAVPSPSSPSQIIRSCMQSSRFLVNCVLTGLDRFPWSLPRQAVTGLITISIDNIKH